MKNRLMKLLAVLASVTLVAGSLAACGGGSSDAASSAASSAASAASSAASEAEAEAPAEEEAEAPAEEASSSSSEAAAGGNYRIKVITMAMNNPYWTMCEAGALLAGQELGVEVSVDGPADESKSDDEIRMVEDAITDGYDAIAFSPNNPDALVVAAQAVKDAGLPLVTFDMQVSDDSLPDTFTGTNGYEAGKLGGEFAVSQLSEGDKCAILRGPLGSTNHDSRTNGFVEAAEAGGLVCLEAQPAEGQRQLGVTVTENILQANPDVKCIYATNDEMALGAIEACRGLGYDDMVIIGFDGTFDAMDAITAGDMAASVAQQPVNEGYSAVELCVKLLNGETVEKDIPIDVVVLTKDNVEEFRAEVEEKVAKAGVTL